jgi:hypothetical protein
MSLSRPQPVQDLFSAEADHEPHRGSAHLTSVQPSVVIVSTADKSSPRYVLPGNLSDALQQLDDFELDRLVAAARHELQRRGRAMISTPETRPKPSIAKDQLSKRQQLRQPNGTLTQGHECGARNLQGWNRAFPHRQTIRDLPIRCAKGVGIRFSNIWKRPIIAFPSLSRVPKHIASRRWLRRWPAWKSQITTASCAPSSRAHHCASLPRRNAGRDRSRARKAELPITDYRAVAGNRLQRLSPITSCGARGRSPSGCSRMHLRDSRWFPGCVGGERLLTFH